MSKPLKTFDKVEKYWGTCHDVINVASRKCVATLWTLAAAKKEAEYFSEYVGMDLRNFLAPKGRGQVRGFVVSKKAKDGVYDIVVDIKKFNRKIFNTVMNNYV